MKIRLNAVRLAFPDLFTAKAVNGEGEPAFAATFLIAPDDPQVKVIRDAIVTVAREKWGAKADAILKQLEAAGKVCLQDGNKKEHLAGYAGNLYLPARSKERPLVIDADKSPLLPADGRPYSGCYVNASVDIWAMDNQFGKRIAAGLKGVQFHKDGDAFSGGGAASADDFDDVSAPAETADIF